MCLIIIVSSNSSSGIGGRVVVVVSLYRYAFNLIIRIISICVVYLVLLFVSMCVTMRNSSSGGLIIRV